MTNNALQCWVEVKKCLQSAQPHLRSCGHFDFFVFTSILPRHFPLAKFPKFQAAQYMGIIGVYYTGFFVAGDMNILKCVKRSKWKSTRSPWIWMILRVLSPQLWNQSKHTLSFYFIPNLVISIFTFLQVHHPKIFIL